MIVPQEGMGNKEVKIILNKNNLIFFILQNNNSYSIVVLGKGTVGKTSLIFRYIKNECPKDHDPTVEDSYTVLMQTKNGQTNEFKILDTAGEEDYQNMLDQWIISANGFLLMFAINDEETFEALKEKLKRIQKNDADKLPIILVGNKCDLQAERKVTKEQAEEFAKTINAKYFETSALTDFNGNVKVVFQECADKIVIGTNEKIVGGNGGCCFCSIY